MPTITLWLSLAINWRNYSKTSHHMFHCCSEMRIFSVLWTLPMLTFPIVKGKLISAGNLFPHFKIRWKIFLRTCHALLWNIRDLYLTKSSKHKEHIAFLTGVAKNQMTTTFKKYRFNKRNNTLSNEIRNSRLWNIFLSANIIRF